MLGWAKTFAATRAGEAMLLSALTLVPILYVPASAEVRELPRWTLVEVAAFGSLLLGLAAGRVRFDPAVGRMALFASGALLVSAVAADSSLRALFGPYEGHEGVLAFLSLFVLSAWTPLRDPLSVLFRLLAALGFVESSIALLQWASGLRPTGTLGHPMFLAAFLALSTLVTVDLFWGAKKRGERIGYGISAIVGVAAIVGTGRRTPAVALGLGLLIQLVASRAPARPRKLLWPLLAAMIAVGAAAAALPVALPDGRISERLLDLVEGTRPEPQVDTVGQRLDFYRVAFEAGLERPIAGFGFGAFRDLYASRRDPSIDRFESDAHDLWLTLWTSSGILGVASVLLLVIGALRRARSAAAVSVFAAYLLQSTFNMDQPAIAAWAWALLGASVVADRAPADLAAVEPRLRAVLAVCAALAIASASTIAAADLFAGSALSKIRAEEEDGAAWAKVSRILEDGEVDLYYRYFQDQADGATLPRTDAFEAFLALPDPAARFLVARTALAAFRNRDQPIVSFFVLQVLAGWLDALAGDPRRELIFLPELQVRLMEEARARRSEYARWSEVEERIDHDLVVYLKGKMPRTPVWLRGSAGASDAEIAGALAEALDVSPEEAAKRLSSSRVYWKTIHFDDFEAFVRRAASAEAEPVPCAEVSNEAVALLEEAIALAPFECLYRLKLAAVLRRIDRTRTRCARVEILERCLSREPRNAFLRYHLGLALADSGRAIEAVAAHAEAARLAPAYVLFEQDRAKSAFLTGDVRGAEEAVDRAWSLDKSDARTAWLRGLILGSNPSREADGRASFEAARVLDPRGRKLFDQLAAFGGL